MLAGEPPFTGPTTESVRHQLFVAEPPRVTAMRGTVPASIEAVIRCALAKAPADRFATAAQLVEALAQPAAPVQALVAGPTPAVRRVRRMVALGATVAALVVIGGEIGRASCRERV